jgi:importin-4
MDYVMSQTYPSSALAESGFCFFGAVVKLYGNEISSGELSMILEKLLASCQLQEPSPDEDGEDYDGDDWNAANGIADEKEAAIDVLGVLFEHSKEKFLPYVQKSVDLCMEMLDHFSETLRAASISCLFKILKTLYKINQPVEWKPEFPASYRLQPQVAALLKTVMSESLELIQQDDDMSVVVKVLNNLIDLLSLMGPIVVSQEANWLEILSQSVMNLLQGKSACQADFDTEKETGKEDEEEEVNEYDGFLISVTVELIETCSKTLGPVYFSHFQHFFPLIKKYCRANQNVSDRSMVAGFIGETASALQDSVLPLVPEMLQILFNGLDDSDPEVASNSVYSFGRLSKFSPAVEYYPKV